MPAKNRTRQCSFSPVRSPGSRGLGEAAAGTRAPQPSASGCRPPGTSCHSARSSLWPEKRRGAATSPTHHQALRSRRRPRRAGCSWGSGPRIHQRSPLPSSGPPRPGESRGRYRLHPGVRVPVAAAGHRALPSKSNFYTVLASDGQRSLPGSRRCPSGLFGRAGRQVGKPPPQRLLSAPLCRLNCGPCSCSLALLGAPLTTWLL